MKKYLFILCFGSLIFSQDLTLEKELYPEAFLNDPPFQDFDIGSTESLTYEFDMDFNDDGINEIVVMWQNVFFIFDVKNEVMLDSAYFSHGGTFKGFVNVTCDDCINGIIVSGAPRLVDFSDGTSYLIDADLEHLIGVSDYDNDGLEELIFHDWEKIRYFGSGTSASVSQNNIPNNFRLKNNYPNPFNPVTKIDFQVQLKSEVSLIVYDIKGNHVKTLINDEKSVGEHFIEWNGMDEMGQSVASGQYFYQLKVGDLFSTKKMILLK